MNKRIDFRLLFPSVLCMLVLLTGCTDSGALKTAYEIFERLYKVATTEESSLVYDRHLTAMDTTRFYGKTLCCKGCYPVVENNQYEVYDYTLVLDSQYTCKGKGVIQTREGKFQFKGGNWSINRNSAGPGKHTMSITVTFGATIVLPQTQALTLEVNKLVLIEVTHEQYLALLKPAAADSCVSIRPRTSVFLQPGPS
jgi:hypothetical protein